MQLSDNPLPGEPRERGPASIVASGSAPRPRLSARDACREAIRVHLALMRSFEPGIVEGTDPECLHQYRIAVRKIRSLLGIFKTVFPEPTSRQLRCAFKLAAQRSNALRDWDVYLAAHDTYARTLPETLHPGLAHLHARCVHVRNTVHRHLAGHLNTKTYRQRMASIERRFCSRDRCAPTADAQRPMLPWIGRELRKGYRKIRRLRDGLSGDLSDDAMHRLRLLCKRLRYRLEFAHEGLPAKPAKRVLKRLKRLQNRLGALNDCAVQHRLLSKRFGDRSRLDVEAVNTASLEGVLGAIRQRAQRERKAARRQLKAFCAKSVRADVRALCAAAKTPSKP